MIICGQTFESDLFFVNFSVTIDKRKKIGYNVICTKIYVTL